MSGRKWIAKEPSGVNRDLFKRLPNPKKAVIWSDHLVYDTAYLPTRKAVSKGLNHTANLLYWRLVRWAVKVEGGGGVIGPGMGGKIGWLTLTYLSNATNTNRKTVSRNLDVLRDLGLITTPKLNANNFAVGISPLDDEDRSLWRPRWQRGARKLALSDYFGTGERKLPTPAPACRFTKWVADRGIHGHLQKQVLGLAKSLQLGEVDFATLLKKTDDDHRANLVAGKTKHAHCGYLLKHELITKQQLNLARRTGISPEERNYEMEDALNVVRRTLPVRNKCGELLKQVVTDQYVQLANGQKSFFSLRWSDVKEAAKESKRDLDNFKERIACQVIPNGTTPEGACPWLDQWRGLRAVPEQCYTEFQDRYRGRDSGVLYTDIIIEIEEWAKTVSKDEADAQANANWLIGGIVQACSPNKESIAYGAYRDARQELVEAWEVKSNDKMAEAPAAGV